MGKPVSSFRIHKDKEEALPGPALFVDKPGKMCYTV